MQRFLAMDGSLAARSRLFDAGAEQTEITTRQWLILSGCGLLAAAAAEFLDFSLRIPGHAILRSVLPISPGPRQFRQGRRFVMAGLTSSRS